MLRRLIAAVIAVSSFCGSNAFATGTDAADQSASQSKHKYVFPFSKVPVTYSRDHLNYPATDVHGCYAQVLAPTSGVIFDVEKKDKWDEKIEKDILSGRLAKLATKTDEDFEAGRCSPL